MTLGTTLSAFPIWRGGTLRAAAVVSDVGGSGRQPRLHHRQRVIPQAGAARSAVLPPTRRRASVAVSREPTTLVELRSIGAAKVVCGAGDQAELTNLMAQHSRGRGECPGSGANSAM
jgi:hypothetical protein